MPQDLPRWQSVYTYFRAWENDATWVQRNDTLRRLVRLRAGRNAEPSPGSVDSHRTAPRQRRTVKTAHGGEETAEVVMSWRILLF